MMLDGDAGRADGLCSVAADLLHAGDVVVAAHLNLDGDQSGNDERDGNRQGDDDAGDGSAAPVENCSETAADGGKSNRGPSSRPYRRG